MINLKDKRIYLSGKITGRARAEVEAEFAEAKRIVARAGAYSAFNPIEEIEPTVSHRLAMRFCLRQLARSKVIKGNDAEPYYDYLVTIPGWEQSQGATMEVAAAKAFGIRVITLDDVLGDFYHKEC